MKSAVLRAANTVGLILAFPWIAWSRIGLLFKSENPYLGCAYSLAIVPGILGILLRRAFYRHLLISSDWGLWVAFGSVFTHPNVRLGRRTYIGSYCLIGQCRIGDDVIIGSRVSIPSGRHQHRFDDGSNMPRQDGIFEEINIGSNVWIGEGAIVMADVGQKAVVGAGTVVVKPVRPGTVVVGNPARETGGRKGMGEPLLEESL